MPRHSGNSFEILRRQLNEHTIKADIVKIVDELVEKIETPDEKPRNKLSENARMRFTK